MSDSPVVTPSPAVPQAPAAPKTAIQILEEKLSQFKADLDNAVSNVHMIRGAIRGAEITLAALKGEEAKAAELAGKAAEAVKTEVEKIASEVKKEL